MKKLIVAALFSAASLAQAGPLIAATSDGDSASSSGGLGLVQRQEPSSGLSSRASEVVFSAMGKLGVPYRLGGNSRATGFDCSGLVHAVYKQTLGLVLPRRAAEQASSTQTIAKDELRPGDLVFFNTLRRSYSHVGIYIGDNKFIHAPRTGAHVRVENMDIKYWRSRFDGARRVLPSGSGGDERRLASAFEAMNESRPTAATSQPTVQLALAEPLTNTLSTDTSSRDEVAELALRLARNLSTDAGTAAAIDTPALVSAYASTASDQPRRTEYTARKATTTPQKTTRAAVKNSQCTKAVAKAAAGKATKTAKAAAKEAPTRTVSKVRKSGASVKTARAGSGRSV